MDITVMEYMSTKQYKTLSKESGKEYAREFIGKTDRELKDAILRYMVDKNKADADMKATPSYSLAEAAKKKREAVLKDALKPYKLKSDYALERLERISLEEKDKESEEHIEDSKPYNAAAKGLISESFNEVKSADKTGLENIVLEYQKENKHATAAMKQEPKYTEHSDTVKLFRKAAKDAVKPQKACADMAIEILRQQKGGSTDES